VEHCPTVSLQTGNAQRINHRVKERVDKDHSSTPHKAVIMLNCPVCLSGADDPLPTPSHNSLKMWTEIEGKVLQPHSWSVSPHQSL
jgi:hypothetical protein